MNNLFRIDSPLIRFLAGVGDLLILNFLYILCCVPVITIGASTAALYRVRLNVEQRNDISCTKAFFRAFRENWKPATLLFLIMLLPLTIAVYYVLFILAAAGQGISFLFIISGIAVILILMTWSYLWPLQAQFENSIGNTLKNAILFSVAHFPTAFIMAAMNALPYLLLAFFPAFFIRTSIIWLLLGFSFTAAVNAKLAHITFLPFLPDSTSEEE